MKRTRNKGKLSTEIKEEANSRMDKKAILDGNTETMISTGSTLLDLAISGGRKKGGGLPGGVLVEIFGPSGSGKTVLLSEIAGTIQRQKGQVMFHDPEARLNKQFAQIFDLKTEEMDYGTPDRVPDVFRAVRSWEPDMSKVVNGIFADSLAALSTDIEMDNEEGDKMGMRRAKEFSEELRKTCRILKEENYLMVCSNQIRQTTNQFGPKYKSPGGEAIGFYSSVRLRTDIVQKIIKKKTVHGKIVKRVVGIQIDVEVFKNSVWKPYRIAPVYIYFDYGIDDIRANLQFVKDFTNSTVYTINDKKLDKSLDEAILMIEEDDLEKELKEQVIKIWNDLESKFEVERKPKKR